MRLAASLLLISLMVACTPLPAEDALQVVVTTPILADIVNQIGQQHIEVSVLIQAGTDPHAFEATPQDAAKLADADLVIVNGLGLEEALASLLHQSEQEGRVVVASDGIIPFEFEVLQENEHNQEHPDPHVWMSPINVLIWVDNIAAALASVDSTNAADYQAKAEAYKTELYELDSWIFGQVALLPGTKRQLVTDHDTFKYFAARYGFDVVGVLIPSFSTLSEVSAGELAELQRTIVEHNTPAIFIGASTNSALAERVSTDTGVALVVLFGETLSSPEGPAGNYLDMMRYNVTSIITALQ